MPETKATVERYWPDIRFFCVAEPREYRVDFRAYEVPGTEMDGRPCFNRDGYEHSGDHVSSPAEAQVFLSGYVKWDGCANWRFDESADTDVMLHTCDRADVAAIGEMMLRVYALGKELVPTRDATHGD